MRKFATACSLAAAAALAAMELFVLLSLWPLQRAHAGDDGHFAHAPLKAWFDSLASRNGMCCSFADGRSVADPDWGTETVTAAGKTEMRYWVAVDGKKLAVPPDAVVTEPNRYGPAVVWPYVDAGGTTQIRCFMPGAGA